MSKEGVSSNSRLKGTTQCGCTATSVGYGAPTSSRFFNSSRYKFSRKLTGVDLSDDNEIEQRANVLGRGIFRPG
jgi:hypothetical protein